MSISLQRGVFARVFGGAGYQVVLVFLLVVYLVVAGIVLGYTSTFPPGAIVPGVVVVALVLIGATGGATVDDSGVRWRLLVPHSVPWERIALVDFGGKIAAGSLQVGQASISVHTDGGLGGRGLVIGPVLGVSEARRVAFAQALADAARQHGAAVQLRIPDNWPGVR